MGHSYQARLSGTLHLAVWVDFGGTCNMPTTVLLCMPVSVVHNYSHKLQWRSAMIRYTYYNDSYSTTVISLVTTPPLTLAIHTCTHMTHSHTLLHYSLYIAKRWWAYYMSHQNRPTLPSVVSHWGALGRNGPLKLQCDLCKIPIIGWSDGTKMVDRNVQTKLS